MIYTAYEPVIMHCKLSDVIDQRSDYHPSDKRADGKDYYVVDYIFYCEELDHTGYVLSWDVDRETDEILSVRNCEHSPIPDEEVQKMVGMSRDDAQDLFDTLLIKYEKDEFEVYY